MSGNLEKLVERNQNLSKIAKAGYYLDSSVLYYFETDSLIDLLINWSDDAEIILNSKLSVLLNENIANFRKQSLDSLEKRSVVVNAIYDLFTEKNFLALIPLVLSQVDGIMKEVTGGWGMYNSNAENDKIAPNQMKYLSKDFYLDFFSQYEFLNAENRNEFVLFRKNVQDVTAFNRHAILHGESFDFGTNVNGIKSLLLFIFVGELYRINVHR